MTRDISYLSKNEEIIHSTEEAYIIILREKDIADIIHLKKTPSFFEHEDEHIHIFQPANPKNLGRELGSRNLRATIYKNIRYITYNFQHCVNTHLPTREVLQNDLSVRINIWANPLVADSLDLQKAILKTNAFFKSNNIAAHASSQKSLLIFLKEYIYTHSISSACYIIWQLPQRYNNLHPHSQARRRWTFFTFSPSFMVPPKI